MNCMAFRYPSRVPFNKLKMETYLFLDSVTPSTAFAKLAVNQGEKTQKLVAKYVCDRLREKERCVKYNLVKCTPLYSKENFYCNSTSCTTMYCTVIFVIV